MRKISVNPESYHDFKPGDRVIADGYPGKVTAVNDGPVPGMESYSVLLDNGVGGGEYGARALYRQSGTTAAHDGDQYDDGVGADSTEDFDHIEAGIHQSAAFWYPELGSILDDRPPNERVRMFASIAEGGKIHFNPGHGAAACGAGARWQSRVITTTKGVEKVNCASCQQTQAYRQASQHTAVFKERLDPDTDRALNGVSQVDVDQDKILTSQENNPPAEQPEDLPAACSFCGSPEFYDFQDTGRGTRVRCQQCGGTMVKNPEGVQWQPEFPNSSANAPSRRGDDRAVINDLSAVHSARHVLERPATKDQRAEFEQMDADTRDRLMARASELYDGTRTVSRCWHQAFEEHHGVLAPEYEQEPYEPEVDEEGFHAKAVVHQADAGDWCRFRMNQQCMLPQRLNPDATAQAGYTIFTPMSRGACNRYTPVQQMACPTGMPKLTTPGRWVDPLYTAARKGEVDREFAFHFTAAWRDVVAKGKRIKAEGGVRVLAANKEQVVGEVRGDHNIYETIFTYVPGTKKIAAWFCGCKWGAYAWGRSPAYRRFEGRECSHVAALRFEVGARGMFGREIMPDVERMEGQHPHAPVVEQYQRPVPYTQERAPSSRVGPGNLPRRTVPPGNVRHEWTPRSRVRTKGSLDS